MKRLVAYALLVQLELGGAHVVHVAFDARGARLVQVNAQLVLTLRLLDLCATLRTLRYMS